MADVRPVSRNQPSRRHSYGPSPVVGGGIDSGQLDAMNLRYGSDPKARPKSRLGSSRSLDLPPGRTPPVSPDYTIKNRPRSRPKSAKGRARPGSSAYRESPHPWQIVDSDSNSSDGTMQSGLTPRPGSSLSKYKPLPGISRSTPVPTNEVGELTRHAADMNIQEREMESHSEMIGLQEVHIPSFEDTTMPDYYNEPLQSGNLPQNSNANERAETRPGISKREYGSSRTVQGTGQNSETSPVPQAVPVKRVTRRDLRQKQQERIARVKLNVAIPDEPVENEDRVLLAIRLPEGERLQRYFRPTNTLKEILAYADSLSKDSLLECEMFVNDVPRKIFTDLSKSIHESKLSDKTVIYLEEKDD
ncbi:UBX domain-containing protein 10-like [Ptychodera flava]|uniref:UBX domain-containing protein 10-like n=1 Tax=Ptychodera flava TaxID=63121 RepID=UPI00396A9DF5